MKTIFGRVSEPSARTRGEMRAKKTSAVKTDPMDTDEMAFGVPTRGSSVQSVWSISGLPLPQFHLARVGLRRAGRAAALGHVALQQLGHALDDLRMFRRDIALLAEIRREIVELIRRQRLLRRAAGLR